MSINWIHLAVYAPMTVLTKIKEKFRLANTGKEPFEIIEDADGPHLFTECRDIEDVMGSIARVSAAHPDCDIRIRYCASLPGSYHEIIEICRGGEMIVESDTVERILYEED